jgi:hypothetical protein
MSKKLHIQNTRNVHAPVVRKLSLKPYKNYREFSEVVVNKDENRGTLEADTFPY